MSILLAASGPGFVSPGPGDFVLPGFFGSWFTKPMLIVVLMALGIWVFYYLSARKAAVVPSRLQFAGEYIYGFVRNSIAHDVIGHEGQRFVPYLVTLFTFVAALNLAGIIPILQFPATSRIAFPMVFAFFSWVIYLALGIRRAGPWGYFKEMMFPPGIPWPVYLLLAPIELFSNVFVRPITLTLRLTFNMFAGHLVLLLFVLGGDYLLFHVPALVGIPAGGISLFGSIVLTGFEGFVQVLQAYVFTLLSAIYIGGALADHH